MAQEINQEENTAVNSEADKEADKAANSEADKETNKEAKMSPLELSSQALAFFGDSVFEQAIRKRVVTQFKGSIEELNKRTRVYTSARAQAVMATALAELFTEEENGVYRRARNVKSLTAPKSASISEYRRATGLEALMGYLYLSGKTARMNSLINKGMKALEKEIG